MRINEEQGIDFVKLYSYCTVQYYYVHSHIIVMEQTISTVQPWNLDLDLLETSKYISTHVQRAWLMIF